MMQITRAQHVNRSTSFSKWINCKETVRKCEQVHSNHADIVKHITAKFKVDVVQSLFCIKSNSVQYPNYLKEQSSSWT